VLSLINDDPVAHLGVPMRLAGRRNRAGLRNGLQQRCFAWSNGDGGTEQDAQAWFETFLLHAVIIAG